MGLSDSRPGPPMGYVFPMDVMAGATPRRASQVPRPICRHAPSPITPESPATAYARFFTASSGLHLSWTDSHSQKFNEAETGSLALRLAPSPHEASPDRVAPSHARSATCQTGNLQGRLLSACKIGQALPGAPGLTGYTGCVKDVSPFRTNGKTLHLPSREEVTLKCLHT